MLVILCAEVFILIVINSLTLWVINKKTVDPTFTIQEKVKEVRKAWGKNKKYKPYVNDDHTAWMKENSKA